MTVKEFITWVQGYYGAYPEGQKKDIAEYLGLLSSRYLSALKKTLLLRYSSKWRIPPDVAIFKEYHEEVMNLLIYEQFPLIEDGDEELVPPEKLKKINELLAKTGEKGDWYV